MPDESKSTSDAFRRAVVEYLEAVDAGAAVNREEFLARHPEVRDELREFLLTQDELAQAAAEGLASASASGDAPTLVGESHSQAGASTVGGYEPANPARGRPARERVGYFGDYELLAEIARGGMGVVYKARQANLDRVVALKMILAGQLASPADVRRFYQEAEAAANLEHPGIVPIYEVGQHAGQHFFSMAFVDGPSLAQIVAEGPLPPKEAAGIVKHVAEAMAYAHSKGVVHRDLKPANVLLARIDNRTHAGSVHGVTLGGSSDNPDRRGVYEPKVTDFGLAKRTEGGSELTGTGQVLGTPAYMPPEQAAGLVKQIGPLADVYSLGAILYCLLTGRPPFQAANVMDTLMQVLQKEPLSPRDLNPQTPKDLETIALKCLQKDRQKRYGSVKALADELGRYLQGEPILARPVGRVERAAKWVRRYPVIAGLLLLVALSLVIGTTVSTLLAIEANQRAAAESAAKEFAKKQEGLAKARERDATQAKQAEERHRQLAEKRERDALTAQANESVQRKRAELREKEALWHLYVARMFPMMVAWTKRDFGQLEYLLEQSTPHAGEPDFRGWEWHYFQDQCRQASRAIEPGSPCAGGVAWNAKTGEIAIATNDGTIEIWDEGGAKTRTLKPKHRPIYQLAWSADGQLACGAHNVVTVWDAASDEPRFELTDHTGTVWAVAWSADGKRLASAGNEVQIRIWDSQGTPLRTIPIKEKTRSNHVVDLDWSPDGVYLAAAQESSRCAIWNSQTGELVKVFSNPSPEASPLAAVAWSPDGTKLAAGHVPNIIVRDLDGRQLSSIPGDASQTLSLQWSPDGQRLASGGNDHTVRVWDFSVGAFTHSLNLHQSPVKTVAWNDDGSKIVSASAAVRVSFLEHLNRPAEKMQVSSRRLWDVAWSPNGKYFACSNDAAQVHIYDAITKRRLHDLKGHRSRVQKVVWSPDGSKLVSVEYRGLAIVWDSQTGDRIKDLTTNTADGGHSDIAWSPDGKRLAIASYGNTKTTVWDFESGKLLATLGNTWYWCIAWSPNGRYLAGGMHDGVYLWDMAQYKLLYKKKPRVRRLGALL